MINNNVFYLFVRSARMNIAESYIPLMQTILEAPPTSPLCNVDVNNITDFVINLSAPVKSNVGLLI